MRGLLALLIAAALVTGGWWYVSPWLAMQGLAEAAAERDTAELEARIDFGRLRDSARSQLGEALDPSPDDTLGAIAGVIAGTVGGAVIDTALTPNGMARLIESGALVAGLLPERLRGQDLAWDVERSGFGSFRGVGTFADGTPGPVLIFTREGIGWRMTGFDLPGYR